MTLNSWMQLDSSAVQSAFFRFPKNQVFPIWVGLFVAGSLTKAYMKFLWWAKEKITG